METTSKKLRLLALPAKACRAFASGTATKRVAGAKRRFEEKSFRFGAPIRLVVITASLALVWGIPAAEAKPDGIPKSAPAFTKFVARIVQDLMPAAKVSVAGRLQLNVEAPNGGHTTDLHNVYSTCRRNPDGCKEEVAFFVAQMIEVYKEAELPPTREALRIVLRPSAYVAAIHDNPERNRPLAVHLAGDYWAIAVADHPTSVDILDENDLSALNLSAKEALSLASENTRNALRQSVESELAKGGCKRGILGGDSYVSSVFAFPDLWASVARNCDGELLVSVPAPQVVLYIAGKDADAANSLKHEADRIMTRADRPLSDAVFRWSPGGWLPLQTPPQDGK